MEIHRHCKKSCWPRNSLRYLRETGRIAMDTWIWISMESAAPASSFTPRGTPQWKRPGSEKRSCHLCHYNTLTLGSWLWEIQVLFKLVLPEVCNSKAYCVHKKVQGEKSSTLKQTSHPSASSVCNRTRTSWPGCNQGSAERSFPHRAKGVVISWNGEISS